MIVRCCGLSVRLPPMLLVLVFSTFSSLLLLGALVVERHLMLTRWVLRRSHFTILLLSKRDQLCNCNIILSFNHLCRRVLITQEQSTLKECMLSFFPAVSNSIVHIHVFVSVPHNIINKTKRKAACHIISCIEALLWRLLSC